VALVSGIDQGLRGQLFQKLQQFKIWWRGIWQRIVDDIFVGANLVFARLRPPPLAKDPYNGPKGDRGGYDGGVFPVLGEGEAGVEKGR